MKVVLSTTSYPQTHFTSEITIFFGLFLDWWCLGDCTASATMNKCSDGEMLTRVGKNTSLEDCQAYCESETSCKFIAHAQDADSRCFTYSSCDTRQDSNQDVIVYEYVSRGKNNS